MAIRTSCFLNLPPSTPSSLPPKTTSQLPCNKKEEPSRGSNFPTVLAAASVIIGLEMASSVMLSGSGAQQEAIAKEVPFFPEPNRAVNVVKWSDRRMCPPWRLNSLESIVPENLPRPSARRRWESVGHATDAPAVKLAVRRSAGDCFSM